MEPLGDEKVSPLLENVRVLDMTLDGLVQVGRLLTDFGASVTGLVLSGPGAPEVSRDVERRRAVWWKGIPTLEMSVDEQSGLPVADILQELGPIDAVVLELPRLDNLTGEEISRRFQACGQNPVVLVCGFEGRDDNDQPPLDEFLLQAASGIMAQTGHPELGATRLGGQPARTLVCAEVAAALVFVLATTSATKDRVVRLNALAALAPCSGQRRIQTQKDQPEPDFAGPGIFRGGRRIRLVYNTKDGKFVCPYHARISLGRVRDWLAEEPGIADSVLAAVDAVVAVSVFRANQSDIETLEGGLDQLFSVRTSFEAMTEAQERGIPAEPIKEVAEVVDDPHLVYQHVIGRAEDGGVDFGAPYVIRSAPSPTAAPPKTQLSGVGTSDLAGMKVICFTTMLAGPVLGKRLSDLGADVWRIESSTAVDFTRVSLPYAKLAGGGEISTLFANMNAGVKSVEIDMATEAGRAQAEQLVREADVLVANYRPGMLKQWGLSTEHLWELNPHLVVVLLSGMGQEGPYASHRIVGHSMAALSGQLDLTGWEGQLPVLSDVPTGDYIAPSLGLFATLSALRARDHTNRGYLVDLSEVAGLVYTMIDEIEFTTSTKEQLDRIGSRDPLEPSRIYELLHCADGKVVAVAQVDVSEGKGDDESRVADLRGKAATLTQDQAIKAVADMGFSGVRMNWPSELPFEESLVEMHYFGPLSGVVDEELLIDGSPVVATHPVTKEYEISLLGADTQSVFSSVESDPSQESGS